MTARHPLSGKRIGGHRITCSAHDTSGCVAAGFPRQSSIAKTSVESQSAQRLNSFNFNITTGSCHLTTLASSSCTRVFIRKIAMARTADGRQYQRSEPTPSHDSTKPQTSDPHAPPTLLSVATTTALRGQRQCDHLSHLHHINVDIHVHRTGLCIGSMKCGGASVNLCVVLANKARYQTMLPDSARSYRSAKLETMFTRTS